MDVSLTPEQINQFLSQAIMESTIGEAVRTIIQDHVKKLSSPYDNPIQKAVEIEIKRYIWLVLRDHYGALIQETIKAAITEQIVLDITTKAFSAWLDTRV